jgi:hypothetical protein
MMTTDTAVNLGTNVTSIEALPSVERDRLPLGLAGRPQSLGGEDENLGHIEERVLQSGYAAARQILEKAAQQKADGAPPLCPQCQGKLSRITTGHWITIQTRFGPIRLQRARGYCQRCRKWRFPADALLGLPETDMQSPAE